MGSNQRQGWRLVASGSPEEVECIKREEFDRLTPQEKLDLYCEQIAAYHNFDQLRLERVIRFVEVK